MKACLLASQFWDFKIEVNIIKSNTFLEQQSRENITLQATKKKANQAQAAIRQLDKGRIRVGGEGMLQQSTQKKNFLKCIKERIWTFKVFRGDGEGEVVINFDVSHLPLEYDQQAQPNEDERVKTLFILYHTKQKKDCFFFSPVECDQYDTLYQHFLYGSTIHLPNLHSDPQNIEKLLERDSVNTNSQDLVLSNTERIQLLDLLEISLVQEVELIGSRQFKNVVIYITRQKFKEILRNETLLDLKIQKLEHKIGNIWNEFSNSNLSEIIKTILQVITKEYRTANHNSQIDAKIRKDQLYLFWPLLDETDFSNPYIDIEKLKSRNKMIDLKPGHHIFIWPGTLTLFCNSQKHAIYQGNNKVVTLSQKDDLHHTIQTMTLQQFKQEEQYISLCEYGIKEEDAFFRRAYTYNNRSSDHPFKVLIRSHILQSLKEPLQFQKDKFDVDYLPKICKTGFFFDQKTKKFHSLIDKVIAAFNDTFFVSLGQ